MIFLNFVHNLILILNLIFKEIVILDFQLSDFFQNDHFYKNLFDDNIRRLINYIIIINFRLFQINRGIFLIKNERVKNKILIR